MPPFTLFVVPDLLFLSWNIEYNSILPTEPTEDPNKAEVTVDSAGNLFLPVGMATTTDLKHELLQNKDVKNLSTAALVNLVKKLESAQHHSVEKIEVGSLDSDWSVK